MPPVVRLSDKTYERLESHAVGFDTPAAVIERLLNEKEGIKPTKQARSEPKKRVPLPVKFLPDEVHFRQALLKHKEADVLILYEDGTEEKHIWNASKFSEKSNLRGNLASGYLRGWQDRGIEQAVFSVKSD